MTFSQTQNESYGFFGEINTSGYQYSIEVNEAWGVASAALLDETGQSPEAVCAFLDSSYGRHFADDVFNGFYHGASSISEAVSYAVKKWSGWKRDRDQARAGAPKGCSYLLGAVIHVSHAA